MRRRVVLAALLIVLPPACDGRSERKESEQETPRIALPAPVCPAMLALAAAGAEKPVPTPIPCRTPTASCLECHP